MKTKPVISAALAVFGSVCVCQSQIITNGSFEDSFNGWSVSGNAWVEQLLPGCAGYTNGTNAVVFSAYDTPPNAVLSQTFPTLPGERYALKFGYGSQQGCGGTATNGLSVELLGNWPLLSNVVTEVGVWPTINMVAYQFYFWADSTNTTLTFRDASRFTQCQAGHLDNVGVERVGPALSIRVSQVELCWYSQTNQVWQVQYRSPLTTNTWTDLGPPVQGASPMTCINDSVAPGSPQRFYQVIRVP